MRLIGLADPFAFFARAATAVIALASRWELSRRLGKFKFVNKRLNLTIA